LTLVDRLRRIEASIEDLSSYFDGTMATTHTITINAGEKTFPVESGSSLLSALARHNIYVPTACGGRGLCAFCKVKITAGAGSPNDVENARLSPDLTAQGFHLACQVIVNGDVSVEIPPHLLSATRFRGRVVEKRQLTYDIVLVAIELIEPTSITFVPGRYIQIEAPVTPGVDPVVRAYSLASRPSDKRRVEILVRKVPNGACSVWVHDSLAVGQEISFTGPYGDFGLSTTNAPAIFIGGGSGMGPFWSMLRNLDGLDDVRPITYFFGALTQRDLFFVDELRRMQKDNSWFTFVPALSNEPADSSWTGERGLVPAVVARCVDPGTYAQHEAYLCGSPGMIDACVKTLTAHGMQAAHVFFDKFA